MDQLGLFDSATFARAVDPETSHEAAREMAEGIATHARSRMLMAWATGPMTAMEAAQYCVDKFGEYDRETYRKRKHELQRLGFLRFVEVRPCKVTGRKAEVWRAKR
jgi:hypothetical protein